MRRVVFVLAVALLAPCALGGVSTGDLEFVAVEHQARFNYTGNPGPGLAGPVASWHQFSGVTHRTAGCNTWASYFQVAPDHIWVDLRAGLWGAVVSTDPFVATGVAQNSFAFDVLAPVDMRMRPWIRTIGEVTAFPQTLVDLRRQNVDLAAGWEYLFVVKWGDDDLEPDLTFTLEPGRYIVDVGLFGQAESKMPGEGPNNELLASVLLDFTDPIPEPSSAVLLLVGVLLATRRPRLSSGRIV